MSEENTEHRGPGQVDPEKLKARIQQVMANEGGGMDNPIPLDLDPEVVARLAHRESVHQGKLPSETEEEDAVELDPNRGQESSAFDGETPDNAGIKAWALQMPQLTRAQITPTQTDKMLYLKAMLNDVPVEFKIALPIGDLTIKIRSLNNYEQDVIFKALEMDQKDEMIAGPAQYVTRLQYYSGLLQITEFNGVKQDAPEFTPTGEYDTTLKAATYLREKTHQYIGANNWPTWQVKLTGLRIFEAKLGHCNREVIDENFWMPAGTN